MKRTFFRWFIIRYEIRYGMGMSQRGVWFVVAENNLDDGCTKIGLSIVWGRPLKIIFHILSLMNEIKVFRKIIQHETSLCNVKENDFFLWKILFNVVELWVSEYASVNSEAYGNGLWNFIYCNVTTLNIKIIDYLIFIDKSCVFIVHWNDK